MIKSNQDIAFWMLQRLKNDGALYQVEVVEFLEKEKHLDALIENANGNIVISPAVLSEFRKLTKGRVVWIRGELYWRFKTSTDGDSRFSE